MKNRISRKLKKRIVKVFGIGTYQGIVGGFLKIETWTNKKGVIVKYTSKQLDRRSFQEGQCNPYIMFLNVSL